MDKKALKTEESGKFPSRTLIMLQDKSTKIDPVSRLIVHQKLREKNNIINNINKFLT